MPIELSTTSSRDRAGGARGIRRLGIAGFCLLCPLTDVKVGDVQTVEVWSAICLFICWAIVSKKQWTVSGPRPVINLMRMHSLFFILMLLGSIFSLRLHFYPPGDFGFLKSAPWLSFFRFGQIVLAASSLFVVAQAISDDVKMLQFALKIYVWASLISAIYAIASFIGWEFGIELPGAYSIQSPRAKGFFIEGGPFGVFLVGGMVLQGVRYYILQSVGRFVWLFQNALLLTALVMSQSKAGIALGLSLTAWWLVLRGNKISLIVVGLALAPIIVGTSFYKGLEGYQTNLADFDLAVQERPDDNSLVLGRIMATALLPRMVAEHPIAGIGIGNYSLIRNDPEILQGLPSTTEWDSPGLGILGYAAELGIPLTIFALWIVYQPIRAAKKLNHWIGTLSAYPLGAMLFGVQMNFAYPWIVAGIAMAACQLGSLGKYRTSLNNFIKVSRRKIKPNLAMSRSRISLAGAYRETKP